MSEVSWKSPIPRTIYIARKPQNLLDAAIAVAPYLSEVPFKLWLWLSQMEEGTRFVYSALEFSREWGCSEAGALRAKKALIDVGVLKEDKCKNELVFEG